MEANEMHNEKPRPKSEEEKKLFPKEFVRTEVRQSNKIGTMANGDTNRERKTEKMKEDESGLVVV